MASKYARIVVVCSDQSGIRTKTHKNYKLGALPTKPFSVYGQSFLFLSKIQYIFCYNERSKKSYCSDENTI